MDDLLDSTRVYIVPHHCDCLSGCRHWAYVLEPDFDASCINDNLVIIAKLCPNGVIPANIVYDRPGYWLCARDDASPESFIPPD